jgi:hypothetical protein
MRLSARGEPTAYHCFLTDERRFLERAGGHTYKSHAYLVCSGRQTLAFQRPRGHPLTSSQAEIIG